MKRARLTKAARAAMWQAQDGKCGCGCGESMEGHDLIEEHTHAFGLGGTSKPDALWIAGHTKTKTYGRKGTSRNSSNGSGDLQRIAKCKRIAKKLAQPISAHNGRVIPSRPFKRPPYESPWPRAAERQT
jgi:hypothetical protein